MPGPSCWNGVQPGLGVHGVLKALAHFEFGLFGSLDHDFLARTGIAPFAGRTIGDTERAEPNNSNFITGLQRRGDAVKYRVNRRTGIRFRKTRGVRYESGQVVLIHFRNPYMVGIRRFG